MVSIFLRWVLEQKTDYPILINCIQNKTITISEKNINVLKSEIEKINDKLLHKELDDVWKHIELHPK